MTWLLVAGAGFALLVLLVSLLLTRVSPLPSEVERLREPRITVLPAVRVLAASGAGGVAKEIAAASLGKIFRWYFRLPGVPRRLHGAPRARWKLDAERSGQVLGAHFGIPVPESVTALPEGAARDGVALETWEYGEVAEILHDGPYAEEATTVDRLRAFAGANGCALEEEHEEEYVRGPGVVFAGDPRRYATILRYRVARR